jgi:hypothetical protein
MGPRLSFLTGTGLVRFVSFQDRLLRSGESSFFRGAADMDLFYDLRDDRYHERLGSQILYWLDDLGAIPLDEAGPDAEGFLFAGARPIDDYRELIDGRPLVRDRPEERESLLLRGEEPKLQADVLGGPLGGL